MAERRKVPPGYRLVFRAFITLKDGTKLWARQFGLKAWPIPASRGSCSNPG